MSAISFPDFVRECGLLPRKPVVPDGRWHRCPTVDHPGKRNGAYKFALDGLVGWVQNHAAHTEALTWRPDEAQPENPADREALARMIRERQRERGREAQEASDRARAAYAAASPLFGGHPYLERKGLDMRGCRGLRVDADGWLCVPMGKPGHFMSLQRISPDGEKKFAYGAPVKGARYRIDRPRSTVTVFVEGLATGLAVFASMPNASVVVTFTASNLPTVAEELGAAGLVAVAADNDHRTVCQRHQRAGLQLPYSPWEQRPEGCLCNPGRIAGEAAAAVLGCGYAMPEGIEGTDWDDYRQERIAALSRSVYGKQQKRPTDAPRVVGAEIRASVLRAAQFVAAGKVG